MRGEARGSNPSPSWGRISRELSSPRMAPMSTWNQTRRRLGLVGLSLLFLGSWLGAKDLDLEPVAVLSDLEGDAARLASFFERHPFFRPNQAGEPELRPGTKLVHCGDLPDRGSGTLRLQRELLRLARTRPDDVILIAGNRDLNKVRLTSELSQPAMRRGPVEAREAWVAWLHESKLSHPEVEASRGAPETRVDRLRFLLAKTMGAPKAFELRRIELAQERAAGEPSDQEVLQSFLDEVGPGGTLRELLERSRLIARHGNTLFVHGSVTKANFGRVPGQSRVYFEVGAWEEALQAWYQAQLREWTEAEADYPGEGPRPGEGLVAYSRALPGESENPTSVVCSRGLGADGLPTLPEAEERRRWMNQGIHRVVLGHTPVGDVPLVLRSPEADFEVLRLDASRSRKVPGAATLTLEGEGLKVAHLDAFEGGENPRPWVTTLELYRPSRVGQKLLDGRLVIAEDQGRFLTYHLAPKFRVVYQTLEADELERIGFVLW